MSSEITRTVVSAEQYWALSPDERKRVNEQLSREHFEREPSESDLQSIRELLATGYKPGAIAQVLDLKAATVRKIVKSLQKPEPITPEQRIDREMAGRTKTVKG